jgi:hypothetical protein
VPTNKLVGITAIAVWHQQEVPFSAWQPFRAGRHSKAVNFSGPLKWISTHFSNVLQCSALQKNETEPDHLGSLSISPDDFEISQDDDRKLFISP